MAAFVRFDPDRWEPASSRDGEQVLESGGLAALATLAALPLELARGLRKLKTMPRPRGASLELWNGAVSDAQRLADLNWAARAIGLGWTGLDLFGAGWEQNGEREQDGLAVRLAGRKLLAVGQECAFVADPCGGRTYINRRVAEGSRFLWECE